jgi:hypothetical protein
MSAAYCSPICRHATRNQVRRDEAVLGLTMGRLIRAMVPPSERAGCVKATLVIVRRARQTRLTLAKAGQCVSGCGLPARVER